MEEYWDSSSNRNKTTTIITNQETATSKSELTTIPKDESSNEITIWICNNSFREEQSSVTIQTEPNQLINTFRSDFLFVLIQSLICLNVKLDSWRKAHGERIFSSNLQVK